MHRRRGIANGDRQMPENSGRPAAGAPFLITISAAVSGSPMRKTCV